MAGLSIFGGSVGQIGVDSSTGDFEIWSNRALELECLSAWDCEGNLERGLLAGDPERYVEKALEMGTSFRRVSVWGTWRRAHLPGNLRDR